MRPDTKKMFFLVFPRKKMVLDGKTNFFLGQKMVWGRKTNFFFPRENQKNHLLRHYAARHQKDGFFGFP